MKKRFLIDLTDPRFFIPSNDDVMSFVRRVNPSAHSDVGSVLLKLGRAIPGAEAYSPSYASLAYVVLHTAHSRIFAIAYGQRGLAFRLARPAVAEAVKDGGKVDESIGQDWVQFAPWNSPGTSGTDHRLRRWCKLAHEEAAGAA